MSLVWQDVEKLIVAEDAAGLTALLLGAGEAERAALATDVERGQALLDDRTAGRAQIYGLAAIGCLPSAARVAALFGKRSMRLWWGWTPPGAAVEIARARGAEWLAELGRLLAATMSATDLVVPQWRLVRALFDAEGADYPMTDAVVHHWVMQLRTDKDFVAALLGEPRLDLLLPALFTVDELGGRLDMTLWRHNQPPVPVLPVAMQRLIDEGRAERGVILAATVERLSRFDRIEHLRPFAEVHDVLAPTAAEAAPFADAYVAMLSGAAAKLAQKTLRAVDDAGLLPVDVLLEAGGVVFARTEKVLVKAQLIWFAKAAGRHPDRIGEICSVAALAFEQPALELQERALAIVERHGRKLDGATLERIGALASGLGADLAPRAAKVFAPLPSSAATPSSAASPASAATPASPATPAFPAGPAVSSGMAPVASPGIASAASAGASSAAASSAGASSVAEMPGAIGSAAELAEEVAALFGREDPVGWERVLAGLVALRDQDLAAVLRPVLKQQRRPWGWAFDHSRYLERLGDLIQQLIMPGGVIEPEWRYAVEAVEKLNATGSRSGIEAPLVTRAPDGILVHRMVEIAAPGCPPLLVSTPTHVSGNLDAPVLLDRLRRAAAEGWEPLPVDFELALLRVPRTAGPEVAAAAKGLGTEAGRRFAEWLDGGGLSDPVSTRVQSPQFTDSRRVVVKVSPADDRGTMLVKRLTTVTPEDPANQLTSNPDYYGYPRLASLVPMLLPHHREVAAAWLLPGYTFLADDSAGSSSGIVRLAECDGPPGPAMTLAVAYAFGAVQAAHRAAGVDAFLLLASVPGWPPALGAEIAALTRLEMVKLTRVVPALSDAYQSGAVEAVWEVAAAAIPALLSSAPLSSVPRGMPDLLELASRAAAELGLRTSLPGIEPVKGSSRLAKETNRLHAVLSGKGLS